jgi:enoyl-CoA hydratase
MSYSHIQFEVLEGDIAQVTIDRQSKRNALNRELLEELDTAFGHVRGDAALRGLILTGAGDKAFVAGADIGELAALSPTGLHAHALLGQAIFARLENLRKPSLAAVNGFALGGGLELAMACTVRVASETARFGQPEAKLGLIPGYGGTQRLPRLIGRAAAVEMLLTGDMIDAPTAHRLGLVNHVVSPAELLEFSHQLMSRMIASAPLAIALILDAVDSGLNGSLPEGLRTEAALFGLSGATRDAREGMQAFLEKRQPVFEGK